MIGRNLLHYRIVEKLGEGGMGAVYRARDSKLERDVAIKLLSSRMAAGGPEERARFATEARAAAALNHPNIATIHAIEEVDGELFIVMECIEGKELKDLIAGGPLPAARSLDIALQIASGLGAAHEKGIVHRDIKPSNLMVSTDGKVKIMDFGLAKIAAGMHLTKTGTTLGTISYMSPEQVRGESLDHRTDLWSFGVVLYEMLTGRRPFHGDHEQAILYSILNTEPRLSTGSPRIDRVVAKALAKDRDARYQRTADLIAELKSIIEALQESALERSRTVARPRLAVLPFASIKSDPDVEFLGFALADQIIGTLGCVKGIVVRPSIAIRKYQHHGADAPTVGRELQVEFVLTGYYLRQGDAIRLNVELVEAQSNEMLWRDSIQVGHSNVFELQDIVAKKVLGGLEVRFSRDEQDRMRADMPSDPLAYEYYLRAVSYPMTLESDRLAIEMLEKSIDLDPNYAPAFAELGFRINQFVLGSLLDGNELKKAEDAYRRALSLNGDMQAALWNLAIHCTNAGRSDEAAELVERMFRVNPDDAMAHFALGYLYRYTGMLDESKKEVARALALDPKNPRFRSAGFTYVYCGEYRKAYEVFELDQEGTMAIAWRGMTLYLQGEKDRAVQYFDRAAAMEPDGYVGLRHAAISAHIKGDTETGLRTLSRLENMIPSSSDSEHWYLLASAYGLLGERDGCIRSLRRAVEGGFFSYPSFVADPLLDSVRGDPEFQQVLALAKEKYESFKQRARAISDRTSSA